MPDAGAWLPEDGWPDVGVADCCDEDCDGEAGAVVHDDSRMLAARLKPKKVAADERVRLTSNS